MLAAHSYNATSRTHDIFIDTECVCFGDAEIALSWLISNGFEHLSGVWWIKQAH